MKSESKKEGWKKEDENVIEVSEGDSTPTEELIAEMKKISESKAEEFRE